MKKSKQESLAQQAVKEGQIRVEQSRLQEETRQQVTLQQLKQQRLEAQLAVIEQETINSPAQLELTQAQQQVASEQAQVDIAKELALAKLYAENPSYVTLQIALANAQAIKETDKLIFTPDGVFPSLIFNNGAVQLLTSINNLSRRTWFTGYLVYSFAKRFDCGTALRRAQDALVLRSPEVHRDSPALHQTHDLPSKSGASVAARIIKQQCGIRNAALLLCLQKFNSCNPGI